MPYDLVHHKMMVMDCDLRVVEAKSIAEQAKDACLQQASAAASTQRSSGAASHTVRHVTF